MAENKIKASKIRDEINELRLKINDIHLEIKSKEKELEVLETTSAHLRKEKLTNIDIERYSRQLILPGFGVSAQLKLKKSKVLIVGLGGLGCPAAQYLVAAGCGVIGLVDYDVVECSNFHRQTLHFEKCVGMSKVDSAREALMELNNFCEFKTYKIMLHSTNALDILRPYDVILDCSDNVATRYLLNDACVLLDKPLVSGSALQLDGQLTVYNHGELGPCYRCIYPVPPPAEAVTNCGDGGILGAVTGAIGSLQALETIKILTEVGDVLAGRLLIFDGMSFTVRIIKMRTKRNNCAICSSEPMISSLIDYEQFCGMHASDKDLKLKLLEHNQRVKVYAYNEIKDKPHLLIDVRRKAEFEICRLPNSVNVPLNDILNDSYIKRFNKQLQDKDKPIFVVCRRGNDSQIAVEHMLQKFPNNTIRDIVGGLHAWHYLIDNSFPIY